MGALQETLPVLRRLCPRRSRSPYRGFRRQGKQIVCFYWLFDQLGCFIVGESVFWSLAAARAAVSASLCGQCSSVCWAVLYRYGSEAVVRWGKLSIVSPVLIGSALSGHDTACLERGSCENQHKVAGGLLP